MASNGGRIKCIKWDVVLIAAITGAANPFGFGSAASAVMKGERLAARSKNLRNGSRAAKRTAQRAGKNHGNGMKEAASWAAVEGIAEGAGNLIPDDKHWRFPPDDDCEPCK